MRQKNSNKRKNILSVIASLVIHVGLAKLDDLNEACFENIILVLYLIRFLQISLKPRRESAQKTQWRG